MVYIAEIATPSLDLNDTPFDSFQRVEYDRMWKNEDAPQPSRLNSVYFFGILADIFPTNYPKIFTKISKNIKSRSLGFPRQTDGI